MKYKAVLQVTLEVEANDEVLAKELLNRHSPGMNAGGFNKLGSWSIGTEHDQTKLLSIQAKSAPEIKKAPSIFD